MEYREKLYQKLKTAGFQADEKQLSGLEQFYRMLIKKNKVMNLTAITEEDEVMEKHFIDSLTCNRIVDMKYISNIIDVGTGAGFPGIPLKIMYPDITFTLIDSLKKRIRFLNDVIAALDLKGIEAVHGRAEDLARDEKYRAKYDLCVSRAVANLSTLSEYCIPFVKVNGYFVSYKSKKGIQELYSIGHCMEELGSRVVRTEEFFLGSQDAERVLIKIKKCEETSKLYPRKSGIPSKNPL